MGYILYIGDGWDVKIFLEINFWYYRIAQFIEFILDIELPQYLEYFGHLPSDVGWGVLEVYQSVIRKTNMMDNNRYI